MHRPVLIAMLLLISVSALGAERDTAEIEKELAAVDGARRIPLLLELTGESGLSDERMAAAASEAHALLHRYPDPGARSELLSNEAFHESQLGHLETAKRHAEAALRLAEEAGDEVRRAKANYSIGVVAFYRSAYPEAVVAAGLALATYETIGDRQEASRTLTLLGAIHRRRGAQDVALEYHLRALALSEEDEDADGVARAQNNIGLIYWNLGEHDTALEYLLPALEFHRRSPRLDRLATTLANVGLIYTARDEPATAMKYLLEALELHDSLDRDIARAIVLSNLGAASVKLGETDRGLAYIRRSLALRKEAGDRIGEVRALGSIGSTLMEQGRLAEALPRLEEALSIAEQVDALPEHVSVLDMLVTVQLRLGDVEAAEETRAQYKKMAKRLREREVEKRAKAIEIEFETERQRAEVTRLKDEQAAQQRQLLVLVTSVLLLVLLLAAVLLLLRGRARRLAELRCNHAQLRETEQRYRRLFHHGDQPKLLIDPTEQLVIDANEPACRLLDSEAEHAIGVRFDGLPATWLRDRLSKLSPDDRPDEPRFETWIDTRGERRASELWVGPVRLHGRECLQIGVRDVTEARRLEEQRIRTERLESLGQLAGGIAHNFNNSLAAILGHISLARHAAPPDPELGQLLDAAEQASMQGQRLTSQLLGFARGGAPVREDVHVATPLKDAVSFALSGSGNRVHYDIAPDLWPARLDQDQFRQVISNLVINADQAMGEGGVLTVDAENFCAENRLSEEAAAGPYVLIRLSDTGPGIPLEIRDRVLDPYFTTKPDGSGLGLATAFAIVTRHGGSLTVESEEGHGTTISLLFPAVPEAEVGPRAASATVPAGRGRILAMDDEPMLRRFYRDALTALGYRPELVPDGETAVRRYLEEQGGPNAFDLVIFDLTVRGGQGGLAAIDELRLHDPNIVAIVASGYGDSEVMANHRAAGFEAALAKPFTLGELARCLERLLRDGRPAVDPDTIHPSKSRHLSSNDS